MPDIERINPAYRDALLAAREASFAINRQGLEAIERAYADLLVKLLNDARDGFIDGARAERLRQEIFSVLAEFERRAQRLTELTISHTMATVQEIHSRVTARLIREYAGEKSGIRVTFDRLQERALAALVARSQNAANFQTLYRRKIVNLAPEIDRYLNAAVSSGVSAGRGTLDLARIMANDDPRLLAALDRLRNGPVGNLREELHAGVDNVDLAKYGLEEADLKGLRSLLYDARRIHVSESNNAARESNTAALNESPVVIAAKWSTSGRHHIPDACTVLASANLYGYGPGLFPPDKWPLAPHPFCGCYQGGPVRFRLPSEWNTPKGPSRPLERDPGAAEHFDPFADQWTDRERERQVALVRGVIAEVEGKIGPKAA